MIGDTSQLPNQAANLAEAVVALNNNSNIEMFDSGFLKGKSTLTIDDISKYHFIELFFQISDETDRRVFETSILPVSIFREVKTLLAFFKETDKIVAQIDYIDDTTISYEAVNWGCRVLLYN